MIDQGYSASENRITPSGDRVSFGSLCTTGSQVFTFQCLLLAIYCHLANGHYSVIFVYCLVPPPACSSYSAPVIVQCHIASVDSLIILSHISALPLDQKTCTASFTTAIRLKLVSFLMPSTMFSSDATNFTQQPSIDKVLREVIFSSVCLTLRIAPSVRAVNHRLSRLMTVALAPWQLPSS